MAIGVPSLLTAGSDTTNNAASYATAAVLPAANEVIELAVVTTVTSGTAETVVPTHPSITFTQTRTQLYNGTLRRISHFTGVADGSPVSSAITITPNAATQTGCMWIARQHTGVDTASAVVQSNSGSGTGTTFSTSLAAFADAANATTAFAGYEGAGSPTFTAGTGFTLQGNPSAMATPSQRIVGEYQLANDTTPDMTVSSSNAWGFIAVELRAAAAGGGGQPTVKRTSGVPGMAGTPVIFGGPSRW